MLFSGHFHSQAVVAICVMDRGREEGDREGPIPHVAPGKGTRQTGTSPIAVTQGQNIAGIVLREWKIEK